MRVCTQRRGPLALDMTPMIDVVFLLLIFFLTTAQLAELASSDLDLPQESGANEASRGASGLVVNLGSNGTITILDEPVPIEDLPARVRSALAADPNAVPIVRADRALAAGTLNRVMDALRTGGCRSIRLATVSPSERVP
ncbi:MAG: biopolymer transporter ExbD [Phycisphaerales bacterium]|nr:biopolymer transporter ExbD [Phycisphaerales bacterium]